jgi:hypothetical protein
MLNEGFDVLVTFDKNLQYQQNLKKFPISVILLQARNNQYKTLKLLVDKIKQELYQFKPGIIVIS